MLRQRSAYDIAEALVVLDGLHLWDAAVSIERFVVDLVDVFYMWVLDDDIWQGLDIAKAVGNSSMAD